MQGMQMRKSVVPILLGLNIAMFVAQMLMSPKSEALLYLISSDVLARPWTILTSMFMHANLTHLFFNMYALFMFGTLIEQKIGSKRFLILYFVSGLLASIGFAAFQEFVLGKTTAALGASGAIMGVLGMTIMLLPDLKILLFFIIPMSMRTAGILFVALEVAGIFGFGIPGIANEAHLVGLAVGLTYGFILLQKRKTFTARFVDRKHVTKSGTVDSIHLSQEDADEYLRNGRI